MKKLPELYKNLNSKPIDNNRKVYYMKEDTRVYQPATIEEELDSIFHTLGYSYNIPVEIMTKKETYHTSLVARTKEKVLTIDNKTIPISDIIKITKQ